MGRPAKPLIITIEKDIPIPEGVPYSTNPPPKLPVVKNPLEDMEIGDSFFVDAKGSSLREKIPFIRNHRLDAQKRLGYVFHLANVYHPTSKNSLGVRVWRIK